MLTCATCRWKDSVRQGNSVQSVDICRGATPIVTAIPFPGLGGNIQIQTITVWPSIQEDTDYCAAYLSNYLS